MARILSEDRQEILNLFENRKKENRKQKNEEIFRVIHNS